MKGIIVALLLTTLTAQAPAPTTLIHAGALLAVNRAGFSGGVLV